jgi:oligopeptidase A
VIRGRVPDNPFLDPSFEIRWSLLTPALIEPAIREALDRAKAAVRGIADSRDAPTYANTYLALEDALEELNVAWGKVSHLQSVCDSPELRDAHNAMLPVVSSFYAGLRLDGPLWERLKSFLGTPEAGALAGVDRRFVEETTADFREAGADLPPDTRKRLEALETELAQLTQKYSENVLDATNAWEMVIEDEGRLAGLPEHAKAAARASAEAKRPAGLPPAWRFTLHAPSQEPFMTRLDDGELRQRMWTAAVAVGAAEPHENTALIGKILKLRSEKAALLGKEHFADLVTERRMARSGKRALDFIEDLKGRCAAAFERECRELEEFRSKSGGGTGRLAPWDVGYWAERMRREHYAFDEEILRPYFPKPQVISGLFEFARRVFGLTVTKAATETWHPEVDFYKVVDSGGRHIGSFYADWHPRDSKRGGAWMNHLITGGPRPDGTRAPHLGLMCGNMTPPAEGKPALLTHREVETIFHEFGHLIHHLLGEVKIKSLNGINVAWDFVELPSQIMENWCWERESLDLFARHHETGAAIPEELFQKLTAAKNFRSACVVMRQLSLAKMDLVLHKRPAPFIAVPDPEPLARAAISECLVPTNPPAPTFIKRFNHIFSSPVGYAAGYYSYKWAEVLDADAFTRFKREGIFNRATGADFVDKILSRGNSADPAELFRAFMGRDPDPEALLRRCGLAAG